MMGYLKSGYKTKFLLQRLSTTEGLARMELASAVSLQVFSPRCPKELNVVVIVAKPLVQATYTLEGDGPCAIIAYDMVKNVESWFNVNVEHLSFPGLGEAITHCAISVAPISHGGNVESARTHVTERCRRMITPVFDYFKSRIFNKLAEDVAIYKVLRHANPCSVRRLLATGEFTVINFRTAVNHLQHFCAADVDAMCAELPSFIATVREYDGPVISRDEELQHTIDFWGAHHSVFPALKKFVTYSFCIVTASAAAERAFSILKRSFDYDQRSALEDYVHLSCMLQYNKANRK
jgi:hypothetical protein